MIKLPSIDECTVLAKHTINNRKYNLYEVHSENEDQASVLANGPLKMNINLIYAKFKQFWSNFVFLANF